MIPLKRELSDLDFVTYGKFNKHMRQLFTDLGYKTNDQILALFGHIRHIYNDEANDRIADVFFDKLEMSHTIDYSGRLELDYPTTTVSDLLLQKIQIVKINEKDIKDSILLLREHEVGEEERECVNAKYIAKLFSKDWGFYYTATTNLHKIKGFLNEYTVLGGEDRRNVTAKIDFLLSYIEKEPKSFGWKMRARTGPKKKWYREVDEITRSQTL